MKTFPNHYTTEHKTKLGREVRFVISKSDIASQSQIISMIGQLLWVLSPIMSAEQPPMVYALTSE